MPDAQQTPSQTTDRIRARLLSLAFRSLYGLFAWAYDWVSRTFFLGQWRLWQRAALPHLVGPDVLEVGMGTGDLQQDLAKAGLRVWGIDYSPQMLRQAARKARRLGTRFNMCRARAQALPFPDATFNSLVSTFPSEYIVDPRTVREVSRVLRPGGRLVIVPGGWLERRDLKGKTMGGVARLVYGYGGDSSSRDVAHQIESRPGWFRWLGSLKARMADEGFSLEARVASNGKGSCLILVATKRA